MIHLKRSYLIQRLLPARINPTPDREEFDVSLTDAFGGVNTYQGLTHEAKKIFNRLYRLDYMGSAEFEFGTIPKVYKELATGEPLEVYEVVLDTQECYERWKPFWIEDQIEKRKSKERKPETHLETMNKLLGDKERVLWVVCPKSLSIVVVDRTIRLFTQKDYPVNFYGKTITCTATFKEWAGFDAAMFPRDGKSKYVGWLELDNMFYIFLDKEVADRTAAFFSSFERTGSVGIEK